MASWLLLLCSAILLEAEARSFHSIPVGHADHREYESLRFTNGSTTQRSPSEDCNLCIIEALGGVSLVYWAPDDADQTNPGNETISNNADVPYTQLENGFTFTSPSVYVVYSSLQATYACNGGPTQTIGSAYKMKTIGYSSRFLAYGTLSSPDQRCDENVMVGGFHTIDFSELYYHPITPSTTSKAGCPPYVNPRLSMPANLIEIDPAWGTCQPLYYGAFDPPRVLTSIRGPLSPLPTHGEPTPVSAYGPILTTSQESIAFSTPATQGPHVPAIPSQTSSSRKTVNPITFDSSSPLVVIHSQPAVQTSVGFLSRASKSFDSIIPSQTSPIEPAINAPGLPQSAPLPKTISDPTQVISSPHVIPSLPIPSVPPGADALVMLPKGAMSLTKSSMDIQSHGSGAASGEPEIETTHEGSPIIVALPGARPEESPGSASTTINNAIITNTASTAMIIPQTSLIPLSTAVRHALSKLYVSSLITARISPSTGFTICASLTTNTASTALVVTEETHVSISNVIQTSNPARNQMFEINGQLVTRTRGVYGLVETEVHTASGSKEQGGERVGTLILVDGNALEEKSLTRAVTVAAGVASQSHLSSMEQGNSSDTKDKPSILGKSSTNPASATITNHTGLPMTTAATSSQTQPPATNASDRKVDPLESIGGRLQVVMLLIAMAWYYCASVFVFQY